jgi:hypothetical protein
MRRNRNCMWLNARTARRISEGPLSGKGGTLTSRPSLSAASANAVNGRVVRRTTHSDISATATVINAVDNSARLDNNGSAAGIGMSKFTHWPSARSTEARRRRVISSLFTADFSGNAKGRERSCLMESP